MTILKSKYQTIVKRWGRVPVFLVLVLMLALSSTVLALTASSLVFYDPWQSGNADFECENAGCGECEYAYKIDEWGKDGANMDATYMPGDGNTIIISNDDGNSFDFTSTRPVSCVIVKGGTGAIVFYYDPPVYGDTGLFAPVNEDTEERFDISHVSFCYDGPEEMLAVSKTAVTSFTREHFWDIAKKVETDNGYELDGFPKIWLFIDGSGDEAATWTVDVTYEGYEDSGFNVSGVITIENTGDLDAVITAVDDVLAGETIDVACGVEFPYTLPVGETLTCDYDEDGYVEGFNEVTVTTERDQYFADAEIVWGAPTNEINKTVTIIDNGFELGQVTAPDDAQFTYALAFAYGVQDYVCGSYQIDNTATIVETGQSASATLKVNVQCYLYETAYAKGDDAICFIPTFSNWGWTNPILPRTEIWGLWAGAAQCDTDKGTLVGSVVVRYSLSTNMDLTVEFNVDDEYDLKETHVYAGYNMFPKDRLGRETVAPGAYTNGSPFDGSEVYVIVHAVVGIPDPDFGP
jgi:hypothetical protein